MKTPTHDEMVLALSMANGGKVKPFYSSLDKGAALLKRKVGTGAEFMKELQGMGGIKQAEIEDRRLGDLMNAPKMTHEQFMSMLGSKPAPPIHEKVFGEPDEEQKKQIHDISYKLAYEQAYDDLRTEGENHDTAEEEAQRIAGDSAHRFRTEAERELGIKASYHSQYTLPGGDNYREMLIKAPVGNFGGVRSHFGGEPNILASMRLKDRTGPNGEKLLHLEELQSDWHQKGREHGYINPEEDWRITKKLIRNEPLSQEENNTRLSSLYGPKVPNAPFKKNWEEMALKRLIHHAAENNYDGIVVTPGAEQADRYSLVKQVDRIAWQKQPDNTFSIQAIKGEDENNSNEVLSKDKLSGEQLAELIGKEAASKINENSTKSHMGTLRGLDLQVGGEGMKGFYDKKVPNILNSIGKKYGVKTELGGYNMDTNKLHYFPITEDMKKDVLANGLPMYRDGGIVHKAEGGDVSIHKLRNYILQHEGTYGAQRLERAFDEIPNLEDMYDEHALKRAFTGDGQNTNLLAHINPADFEKYAVGLTDFEKYAVGLNSRTHREPTPSLEDKKKKREVRKCDMSTDDYLKYLASIGKLSDVPYLHMYQDETGIPLIPHITGHEGRHRNRALANKGQSKNLIQIHMKGALREDFPRRDREEYINALQKQLASSHNLVYPEHSGEDDEPRRPAIKLPDLYAEGGKVSLFRKHGLPTSSIEDAQRKMGEGHLVFVTHEQDEHPREVRSVSEFHGYVPDQIYTVHPKHFMQKKADEGGKVRGGRVTHAHHLEIEERPL